MPSRDLGLHALHLGSFSAALLLARGAPATWAAAAGFFFASFLLCHDAMHGSLGVSRRANGLLLTLGGVCIGVSGRGARALHLHHHAHALEESDAEGWGARVPAWRAILLGLPRFLCLPGLALRKSPRERAAMLAEWALVLLAASGCALSARGRILLAVTLLLQATLAFWGAHLPHSPPPALLALSRALAFVRWPVLLGVATHGAHHRSPRVPCFTLTRRWREGLEARAAKREAKGRPGSEVAGRAAPARAW